MWQKVMMPKIYYRILQTDGMVKKLKYYDGLVIEAPILEQYTNFADKGGNRLDFNWA